MTTAKHLMLLGDSVFDNGIYVDPGQADVTDHLKRKVEPKGWSGDVRAVDGHVTSSIEHQLNKEPISKPCTFILSVGGNDALGHVGLLEDTTSSQSIVSVLTRFGRSRKTSGDSTYTPSM